jgi:hypothetical protein
LSDSYITNNNTRIAVTPLAIEHIALAENRELICDYNEGKLYIKNGDNLYDITSKVIETITRDGAAIDKCTVIVEGVGRVYIGTALSQIMNSLIDIVDVGTEPEQIMAGYQIDYITITNKNKKIQLAGFANAPDNTVATKVGDTLQWLPPQGGEGVTVYEVIPENNILQMLNKAVQHTSNLDDTYLNLEVRMPPIVASEYFVFRWRLDTHNYAVDLDFSENVGFEYATDGIVEENSTYVFEFETYDHGMTWLAKMTKFHQPKYDQTIINTVLPMFYTKEQIEAFLSWINHIDPESNSGWVDHTTEPGDDPNTGTGDPSSNTGSGTTDVGAGEGTDSGDGGDLDDLGGDGADLVVNGDDAPDDDI